MQNDKSDIKYDELDFIKKVVDDNFLIYNDEKRETLHYVVEPRQAFEDFVDSDFEDISFNSLSDLGSSLIDVSDKQKDEIEKAKELLFSQQINFGFSEINKLPDDVAEALGSLLPLDKDSMTIIEWAEHFMNAFKKMNEDKSIYKKLRNMIDKNTASEKFTINIDHISFNDDSLNIEIKKTFREFVNGTINPNGNKEITDYEFFLNSYLMLDLLGISKEPLSKVRFRNVMNDGFHSYYASSMDLLVSKDNGFLEKSKVMYKLLNKDTKVMHVDDFMKSIKLMSSTKENNSVSFFELLDNDIKNGLVLRKKLSIRYDREATTIKPIHLFLGYFNEIDIIKEKKVSHILLSYRNKEGSVTYFFREIEYLVNKSIEIFGSDNYSLGN